METIVDDAVPWRFSKGKEDTFFETGLLLYVSHIQSLHKVAVSATHSEFHCALHYLDYISSAIYGVASRGLASFSRSFFFPFAVVKAHSITCVKGGVWPAAHTIVFYPHKHNVMFTL